MTISILPVVSQALLSARPNVGQTGPRALPPAEQPVSEPLDAAYARLLRLIDRASRTRTSQALSSYVIAVWSRFLGWQRRRATRLLLNSLDDRTLADIGIRRSDIDVVIRSIEQSRVRRT